MAGTNFCTNFDILVDLKRRHLLAGNTSTEQQASSSCTALAIAPSATAVGSTLKLTKFPP